MNRKAPDPSSAALRAFAVLETVVRADRPIAMAEIVEAHGLPKPTVFRLLATLEEAGLVTREPVDKCYSAGPRLAQLGLAILTNQSVRRERRAILQKISEETGETCNLTMVDGIDVVYVDRVDSQWPLRIDLKPGSRVPLHCSASGKLFLSQLPRGKRRALVESLNLTRCTEHTITQRDALEAELERIRKTGVGIDNEEFLAGLLCVAVPVVDPGGRHVATIALQAPSARLSLERAIDCVPMLRQAAKAMSRTFASRPG
ncbi:MAG TPA: IclR family transcriptional regulator [Usitatibacter sp.]|nr:IclR family transcriptional regulator [Usitatibacter sp.]